MLSALGGDQKDKRANKMASLRASLRRIIFSCGFKKATPTRGMGLSHHVSSPTIIRLVVPHAYCKSQSFAFSTFTEKEYHELADLEMHKVFDTICDFEDDHDVEVNMSVSTQILVTPLTHLLVCKTSSTSFILQLYMLLSKGS